MAEKAAKEKIWNIHNHPKIIPFKLILVSCALFLPSCSTAFNETKKQSIDQYLCSSQRSIKRKRFDDEIVQYSIGAQSSQLARIRSRRQSLVIIPPKEACTESNTPEPVPASAIPSQPVVNVNCDQIAAESVKSLITEPLIQHIVSIPSTSSIPTVTANNITTAITTTAAAPAVAAIASTSATVAVATAPTLTTSTVSSTQQQTISNISTPVLSPTPNATPMIPQTPSIQPPAIVPATVGSPVPRKYHKSYLIYKLIDHHSSLISIHSFCAYMQSHPKSGVLSNR